MESWNRKRYGAHQTVDVNFGGVLKLQKAAPAKPVIETTAAAVFEDEEEKPEQQGGHLALAAPAKSSAEFEERAASGEFDQAEITFKDADGKPAALRPDVLALRKQLGDFKAHGPKVRQPSHHVTIYKPDEPDKAVIAEDEEPETQTLADHPRASQMPKLTPYRGYRGFIGCRSIPTTKRSARSVLGTKASAGGRTRKRSGRMSASQ